MTYPYGTPDQWRQQQELEEERRQRALEALRWVSSRVDGSAGAVHLGILCFECGIPSTEVFQKEHA